MTLIVVQEIVTIWGKASRGGEDAAKRNAVPEFYKLPAVPPNPYNRTLVHHIVTINRGAFDQHLTIKELIPGEKLNYGCVFVDWYEHEVAATYAYNQVCGGAPERTAYPRKVLTLAEGAWGQIRYNGRFGWDHGNWSYHKTVLNIGYVSQLRDDLFLSEPQRSFSDMADLW